MDTMVRVEWRDTAGTRLADATTLARLSETVAAVVCEGGEVIGVRNLEEIPEPRKSA